MADEVSKSGATTGIEAGVQGAITGATYGGGWGAVIGAVIGLSVGTTLGIAKGKKQKKAKRYAKLAAQAQQEREANQEYAQYLQLVRQQRIARAESLAEAVAGGTEMSSMLTGAVSGQQSQTAYTVNYLANDRRLLDLYNSYMKLAGKNASVAKDIGGIHKTIMSLSQAATMAKGASNLSGMFSSEAIDGINTVGAQGTFTNNPTINYYQG